LRRCANSIGSWHGVVIIAAGFTFVGQRIFRKHEAENVRKCVIHLHCCDTAGSGLRLHLFRRYRVGAFDDVMLNKWETLTVSVREEIIESVLKF
jgi:hypothetical protein